MYLVSSVSREEEQNLHCDSGYSALSLVVHITEEYPGF